MHKRPELAIAEHLQVVTEMDVEGPGDSRDRRPAMVLVMHHLLTHAVVETIMQGATTADSRSAMTLD